MTSRTRTENGCIMAGGHLCPLDSAWVWGGVNLSPSQRRLKGCMNKGGRKYPLGCGFLTLKAQFTLRKVGVNTPAFLPLLRATTPSSFRHSDTCSMQFQVSSHIRNGDCPLHESAGLNTYVETQRRGYHEREEEAFTGETSNRSREFASPRSSHGSCTSELPAVLQGCQSGQRIAAHCFVGGLGAVQTHSGSQSLPEPHLCDQEGG